MSDRKPLPGKFVWFELVSTDAKKAQAFYGELFGWKIEPFLFGDYTYEMINAGGTMIGGYKAPTSERQPAHWIAYVSVDDVDAAAKTAVAKGGKLVVAPYDMPQVGRMALIADPQGAQLYLFKMPEGDAPDEPVTPHGRWLWNELHTTEPVKAVSFYEDVIGFTHKAMDTGGGGTYYILESKGGVGRGGVTGHLQKGVPPHWLPYVAVDDADATIARARKLRATIQFGPEDIPNVGRFGVLQDPTGAVLAIMKPAPMPQQTEAG